MSSPPALPPSPLVLLIEDEPSDAVLIKYQLLEQDVRAFVLHTVDSLAAAQRVLDAGTVAPDVVLLDLNLPDSFGVQTVLRCRALTDAPIVVLTGHDDVAAQQAAIQSGAEDFLTKGADGSTLRRAVRYAMLRHQREADARLAASVFHHAHEGVIITDAQGLICDVNQAFSHITGYSRVEVLGRKPGLLRSGRHAPAFYQEMWATLLASGQWSGEVWNRHKNGELFVEHLTLSAVRDGRGRIRHLVGFMLDITRQKEHQSQLEYMAHYDRLTGLPNRLLLSDRLQQAMARSHRNGLQLAVAYLDLDGFKAINDAHGHDVGDEVLQAVALQMRATLREGDTLARLGGDEFVAIFESLHHADDSLPCIERLLKAASQCMQGDVRRLKVSASIGVALYPQPDEVEADQLLRQADQAMYQAKLAGKNCSHFFDFEQDLGLRGRHAELQRIRQALAQSEMVLHYQPRVQMRSGAVIGVEALIRWQHPERGLLAPGVFLPLIENDPLICELGCWVIDAALQQIGHWQRAGLQLPVGVNVAPYHLQHPRFLEQLAALLAQHSEVDPALLEIEIVETSALTDLDRALAVVKGCQQLGLRLALDDFGTGYSSLTYLKRLPVQTLKIDQSFVRDMLCDPDDLAILEGVIGLAKVFRRDVVAEGVETHEHGRLLLQLGCDSAQGYGIARPMPAADFLPWLQRWRPPAFWQNTTTLAPQWLPLLYGMVECRACVLALEHFLQGLSSSEPLEGAQSCGFVRWLRDLRPPQLQAMGIEVQGPRWIAILGLHEQLHASIVELLQLYRAQGRSAALERLPRLWALREQLLLALQGFLPRDALHSSAAA